jgi:hypothetical protein
MAQKLHEMANDRPGEFEAAQQFNNGQMLPRCPALVDRAVDDKSFLSRCAITTTCEGYFPITCGNTTMSRSGSTG